MQLLKRAFARLVTVFFTIGRQKLTETAMGSYSALHRRPSTYRNCKTIYDSLQLPRMWLRKRKDLTTCWLSKIEKKMKKKKRVEVSMVAADDMQPVLVRASDYWSRWRLHLYPPCGVLYLTLKWWLEWLTSVCNFLSTKLGACKGNFAARFVRVTTWPPKVCAS